MRWFCLALAAALCASLMWQCSDNSFRYIWTYGPTVGQRVSGAGIWIGGGGVGYTDYVAVICPGYTSQSYEEPIGWSVGTPLGNVSVWPGERLGWDGVSVRSFPAWMTVAAVLLLVLAPLLTPLLIGSIRAPRRQRRGLCRSCGYNLTGNVSGRCPECGTPTTPPAG